MNEKAEIHAVIENCLALLNNKAGEKIDIVKEFSSDVHFVKGNISKLHQVFFEFA